MLSCLEDTRGQATHTLLDLELEAAAEYVLVDGVVSDEELDFVLHILEETPHHSGQVNNMCGSVLLKHSLRRFVVTQVGLFGGQEDKVAVGGIVCVGVFL